MQRWRDGQGYIGNYLKLNKPLWRQRNQRVRLTFKATIPDPICSAHTPLRKHNEMPNFKLALPCNAWVPSVLKQLKGQQAKKQRK